MIASQHDAGLIELPDRPRSRGRRSDHIIECAGGVLTVAPGIGIGRIVGHLILESNDIILTFIGARRRSMQESTLHAGFELLVWLSRQYEQMILDTVLQPTVARGGDAPVEDQIEIAEGPQAEKVLSNARLLRRLQRAVLDSPGV